MTELILVRHGETDWNRELRFQGQIDVPLNETGQRQAQRLAQRLAHEPVVRLVASDLRRARQTAESIGEGLVAALDTGLATDAGLREQNFGLVDGMRVEDIQREHAAAWAQWVRFDADYAFPGAESTRQFHARVMAALSVLALPMAFQAPCTTVVVTHGGVLDMVYRTALSLPLSGPRQAAIPNAGLNRVKVWLDGATPRFEILDWADIAHLRDLPAQPVYDQIKLASIAAPGSVGGAQGT